MRTCVSTLNHYVVYVYIVYLQIHRYVSKAMVDGLGELCNVGPIPCSKNTTDIAQGNLNGDIEEMSMDGIISG